MGRGNDKLTNFAEIKIRQFRVQTLGYQLVANDNLNIWCSIIERYLVFGVLEIGINFLYGRNR
jgi:hypothetical protein